LRKKIVLIEDHDDNREMLTTMLAASYEVESYSSGPTGLEAIRRNPPDLILLDIGMPNMDGVAVLKEIRSIPIFKRLPVIAVTAHVMKAEEEKYWSAGFDDVVAKPILDHNAFHQRIEKALKNA
jgi:CheY-like chemotaxis protein